MVSGLVEVGLVGANQYTNPWTGDQIELLKEIYPNQSIPNENIEKMFGRKFDSVRAKANSIGLKRIKINTRKYSLPLSKNEIKEKYESGTSSTAIAHECRCSWTNILALLRRMGVKIRDNDAAISMFYKQTPRQKTEEMKRLYLENHNASEIASKLGCSRGNVSQILKNAGIKSRSLSEIHKTRIKNHPEEIERLLKIRMNQKMPINDTKIELKVKSQLEHCGILFDHPFNMGDRFQCDFYIPSLNLIIECDGDYWHNREDMKKRDKAKDAYAKKCGFSMMRIWEHEINEKDFDVVEKIGALNIIKKAIPKAFSKENADEIEGVGLHPMRCTLGGIT